jgi:hypothetical protein
MAPLDYSRLVPVVSWPGGELRVCHRPSRSSSLATPKPYVPYGKSYAFPASTTFVTRDFVKLTLQFLEGAPRLTGVAVCSESGRDPFSPLREKHGIPPRRTREWLTGEYLRALAVNRVIAEIAPMCAVRLYRRPRGEVIGVNAFEAHTEDAMAGNDLTAFSEAAVELERLASPGRTGRPRITPATLRSVSEIARRADAAGASRMVEITRELNVAPATAKKYLRRARDESYLTGRTQKSKGENDG